MNRTQQQRERILAILFAGQGMTRNEINAQSRASGREIPIQTMCRRLRELEDMNLVVSITKRECKITKASNREYCLTGSMRAQMIRQSESAA